jgi:hypothetical protein
VPWCPRFTGSMASVNRRRPPFVSFGMMQRLVTALAVLVSALVHLQLWLDGMRSVDVIGPAFLLNAIGGGVIAVAVLVWKHWLPLAAAIGFGLSTLIAFIVSVTVGLFGVQERAAGVPQVVAAVTEIAAVVFGAWAWWREYLSPQSPDRRRPRRSPAEAARERGR